MRSNRLKVFRLIHLSLFTAYLAFLVYFLFFSDNFGRTVTYDEYRYNLRPFAEISRYLTRVREKDFASYLVNIAGNIILFMPFGFLFPFFLKKQRLKRLKSFFSTFLITVLFCILIEGLQLVTKVGVFDVDDVIMNTFGSSLGYVIYLISVMNHRIAMTRKTAGKTADPTFNSKLKARVSSEDLV